MEEIAEVPQKENQLQRKKVLVSCYQMGQWMRLSGLSEKEIEWGFDFYPNLNTSMPQDELECLFSEYEYWIMGDDQADARVLKLCSHFKGIIKWGVGIDNLDTKQCDAMNIPWTHTPGLFGDEVANVALGYLINLARQLTQIDKRVRQGEWHKPTTKSLSDMTVLVVGFGNIGQALVHRLLALACQVLVVDPKYSQEQVDGIFPHKVQWKGTLAEAMDQTDALISTCELNASTHHMIDRSVLSLAPKGLHLINVSRGAVVDEKDVLHLLKDNHLAGYASDVFEQEPLPEGHPFLSMEKVILGSHNASNTQGAVERTCRVVLEKLAKF